MIAAVIDWLHLLWCYWLGQAIYCDRCHRLAWSGFLLDASIWECLACAYKRHRLEDMRHDGT